ncbi:hypothetical protein J0A68_06385 [Algoriphagus sp. H41]|uniref:DUF2281 domain-containing protein n=1 Tax=Algoriphagus oliviformis TaxID=2811231 RepID=A0ABS3C0V7_9BACT|nr:hypothetical protein [Algoriphagus oliviformis]MBN7810573.1 hypothetical protein [Algoriphagus oliviformis]
MDKNEAIEKTLRVLQKLPLDKILEVSDFADLVFKKMEDHTLTKGIQVLVEKGKSFDFLKEEEELYGIKDLLKE